VGAYRSGYFEYHDLGLISAFFQNGIHRGAPFWVSETNSSHFGIHFTPTLYLLLPFFYVSDSAQTFLVLTAGALAISGSLIWLEARALIENKKWNWGWGVALWFILITSNLWKSVVMSAHFEVFFIPFALLSFRSIRQSRPFVIPFLWAVLALGVRQDIGLFLGCCYFGLALMTSGEQKRASYRLGAFCVVYLLVAVLVILPRFGGGQDLRGWAEWGSTWPGVIVGAASRPLQFAQRMMQGAWLPLELCGAFLHWLNPCAALLIHLPALFVFAPSTLSQLGLSYYLEAFFIPGFVWFGLEGARRIELGPSFGRVRKAAVTLVLLLGAFVSLLRITQVQGPMPRFKFYPDDHSPWIQASKAFERLATLKPQAQRVAMSARVSVFYPGRFEILTLGSLERAEALVVDLRQDPELRLSPDWKMIPPDASEGAIRIYVKTN
jgi:uncharacterized membrane protein